MKKINLMKRVCSVLILLFMCACTTDNINEELNTTEVSDTVLLRGGANCLVDDTIEVIVEYGFPYHVLPNGQILTISPEQQQQIKDDYFDEMSRLFTICRVLRSSCDNVEKWIVIESEYNAAGGPSLETNNNNTTEGESVLKNPDDYTGDCIFNNK